MRVNAVIWGVFATVGMMYASRLAGMDWEFTGLVGLCIGFAVLQGIKHKEREHQSREAAEKITEFPSSRRDRKR